MRCGVRIGLEYGVLMGGGMPADAYAGLVFGVFAATCYILERSLW